MRALVFDGQLRLDKSWPDPQAGNDQSLLKIRRAGICNTDLELIAGYKGFSGVLGHEFAAEVVQGPEYLLGRRVVGEINVACGECDFCRQAVFTHCRNRRTLGISGHAGAFADYLALATRNLHIVPDDVADDAAVFVEPLAAALQVTQATHVSPADRVVVIGAGKLGLLTAQVLKLTGCDLVVVARHERPRRLLENWGIAAADLDAMQENSADMVVDCTGNARGFAGALDLVKPRGTIVLKSTYVGLPEADLTRVTVNEIRVIGSRCGPFSAALRLLSAGLVDVNSLIEARYPLEQGVEAMSHAAEKGALKILLQFAE